MHQCTCKGEFSLASGIHCDGVVYRSQDSLVIDEFHQFVPFYLGVRAHIPVINKPLAHLAVGPGTPEGAIGVDVVVS